MTRGLGISPLYHQYLILYTSLVLISLSRQILAVPICATLYGLPDRQSCNQLSYGAPQNVFHGFSKTAPWDRLFRIPGSARPSGISTTQWDNHVNPAIILANREFSHQASLIGIG